MADVTTPFGFPYPEPTDLVRDGATDIEALAQAANDQFSAGFQFAGQRIYTSSGQFVKADPLGTGDIGLRAIRVRMVGGGAGSGSAVATGGGQFSIATGGNGGVFGNKFYDTAAVAGLPASVTVVRGSGGSGATIGNDNAGNGGTSVFDTQTVDGGSRGRSSTSVNGFVGFPGGVNTGNANNDFIVPGGVGAVGSLQSAGRVVPSQGGGSFLSAAGNAGSNAIKHPGSTGSAHGGGGSGASNGQNQTASAGAAGGNGIVIVEVFV